MGQKTVQHVKISCEMLQKLESINDSIRSHGVQFTQEQDEIIKQYYVKKNKRDLAKMMGICYNTLKRRYDELVENEEA